MDKYDEEIEQIVMAAEPWRACDAHWGLPFVYAGLFAFCGPSGGELDGCGCLTLVHGTDQEACTPELTAAIRADDRLHDSIDDLLIAIRTAPTPDARRAILAPYAEWQRRMDREIRSQV